MPTFRKMVDPSRQGETEAAAEAGAAVAPTDATIEIPFAEVEEEYSGQWADEKGQAIALIKDGKMVSALGTTVDLIIRSRDTCEFYLGEEAVTGKLVGNDKIRWSHGAVWTKTVRGLNKQAKIHKIQPKMAQPKPRPQKSVEEEQEEMQQSAIFEEARARSSAGIDKARERFEQERAKKAAARERVRRAKELAEQVGVEVGEATPDWDENVRCGPFTAGDRVVFVLEELRCSVGEARQRVMNEFALEFGRWDDSIICGSYTAGDRVTWLMQEFGSSLTQARQQVMQEFSDEFTAFREGRHMPTKSDIRHPSLSAQKVDADAVGHSPIDVNQFTPGTVVRIRGLIGRAEMNGQLGEIVQWSEKKQRWQVEMDNGDGKKLFKTENLEIVDLG
mmetsp:Transcript_106034/g.204052  ORF Transcript_106034/g.204052 Transcript_106034/m.204052 type:complete len:390 (-) Transcript_106034:78-1247(-)